MSQDQKDCLTIKKWGCKQNWSCVEFTIDNTSLLPSYSNCHTAMIVFIFPLSIGLYFHILNMWTNIALFSLLSAVLFIAFVKLMYIKKETLLVIVNIGVQFITTNSFGKQSILFVPWHRLKQFLIAEVIVGQQIYFYLSLVSFKTNSMTKEEELIILFQNTRPRLQQVELMYRTIIKHFISSSSSVEFSPYVASDT